MTTSVLSRSPRSDKIKYEYALLIVAKLRSSPAIDVPTLVARNIARMRSNVTGMVHGWLDDWHTLARGDREQLFAVLLGEDEYAIEMRNNSPFAGLLTDEERRRCISKVPTPSS